MCRAVWKISGHLHFALRTRIFWAFSKSLRGMRPLETAIYFKYYDKGKYCCFPSPWGEILAMFRNMQKKIDKDHIHKLMCHVSIQFLAEVKLTFRQHNAYGAILFLFAILTRKKSYLKTPRFSTWLNCRLL